MIKLIVDQKGLFLDLTGLPPFRTPAEVDVTRVNLNTLRLELEKLGVVGYRIVHELGKKLVPPSRTVIAIGKKPKTDSTQFGKRLDGIEGMLRELLSRDIGQTVIYREGPGETLDRLVKEDVDEDFIPVIEIDGLTMSGESVRTEEGASQDDIVELAKELEKTRKKEKE